MSIATINRFINLLNEAFESLSVQVPITEIERLAMLIHQSMDQGRRTYHVSTHVFDMCRGLNARQVLATLFHDVVYYQLDGGFPKPAHAMLIESIREERNLMIRAIDPGDIGLFICANVFGFKPGQILPLYGGMNEFLSALVAIRLLGKHLPPEDLLAIAACIEATVPFRGTAPDNQGPYQLLASRLRDVSRILNLNVSEAAIDRMVTDALVMANQDVASFAEIDPGVFLSTTWLLIEESNAPLDAVGIYSIQDYRGALVRMEGFLRMLNPDQVFHQYKSTPDAEKFRLLQESARKNLAFATDYLGAKIVSIAIVEALALTTGGNCPVSMLLGDIRSVYGDPDRAENFLPEAPSAADVDTQILNVLERGRAKESAHDLTVSPLTAFVYRHLGQAGTRKALQAARKMFDGALQPKDFLGGVKPEMARAMAEACSRIALSRATALRALAQSL